MSDVLAINVPICWFCGREFPGRINNLRLHQKKAHGWAPPPEVCRCVASGTIHECSPESRALCVEPVRGRQGVWRPDPALVAAVREVPDAN